MPVFEMAASASGLIPTERKDLSTTCDRWSEFLITLSNLDVIIVTKVLGAPRNTTYLLARARTLKQNSSQPDVQRRCLLRVTCWRAGFGRWSQCLLDHTKPQRKTAPAPSLKMLPFLTAVYQISLRCLRK